MDLLGTSQSLPVPLGYLTVAELVFLLALSAIAGEAAARVSMPRLSGHVLAGIMFGTHGLVVRLVSHDTLDSPAVSVLTSLCVAAIGTAAGSELKWSLVAPRFREVMATIACLVAFTPLMGALIFYGWATLGTDECVAAGTCHRLAVIAGTVLLGRSPECAIGVIRATKASGPLSSVALGTALSLDVAVVSIMSFLVTWASSASTAYAVGATAVRMASSAAMALGLSVALVAVAHRLPPTGRPVAILAVQSVPFIAARALQGHVVTVDPLLTVIAAAAYTNHLHPKALHPHGSSLLPAALVAMFAIAGSRADLLSLLTDRFPIVASLLLLRFLGLFLATNVASRLYSHSTTPPIVVKYRWMCLVTQGGISLALLSEAMRAVGAQAVLLQDVVVGVITVNLCLGSAMFKYAITQCGEQNKAEVEIIDEGSPVDGLSPAQAPLTVVASS